MVCTPRHEKIIHSISKRTILAYPKVTFREVLINYKDIIKRIKQIMHRITTKGRYKILFPSKVKSQKFDGCMWSGKSRYHPR